MKKDSASFLSVVKGVFDFFLELKTENVLSMIYLRRREVDRNKKITYKELAKAGLATTFDERMRNRIKIYQNWKTSK